MTTELKIKQKHLGAEARIIRAEELSLQRKIKLFRLSKGFNEDDPKYKTLSRTRESVYQHRVQQVRWEARATGLARAFINGKKYRSVEPKRRPESEYWFLHALTRATRMVQKYHDKNATLADLQKWAKL